MSTQTAEVLPQHAVPSAGEMEIPCHLIDADVRFNARHFLDGQGKEATSVKSLAKTISNEGQLSAVQVKPLSNGRFKLIFGFRRFAAISGKKEDGCLEWPTIKATFAEEDASEIDLMFRNLIENVARENLSPYDLAMRCALIQKDAKDDKLSGGDIAKRIGKGTSYVNDLIRYANELHPEILARWKLEHSPEFESTRTKALTTDNLRKIASNRKSDGKTADRDGQMRTYNEILIANKEREAPPGTEDKEGEGGEGGATGGATGPQVVKRPGTSHIKAALEQAEILRKYGKGYSKVVNKKGEEVVTPGKPLDKEETVRINAVVETLQWALATKVKPGQTNAIKGVYSYKDGE